MQKQISPKIVALTFGILTITFLAVFYVVAWQEPSQIPPAGNVAAPLNVSLTGQSKEGGLILNTGGAVNALVIDKGNLCFGATDCRSSWPVTGVVITYKMTAQSYKSGSTYYAKTVSYSCPVGSSAVQTYCKAILIKDSCSATIYNYCGCSISGRNAYVVSYVQKGYANTYGNCEQKPVTSCTPSSSSFSETWCALQGPCEMQFQCGIVQTVGQ